VVLAVAVAAGRTADVAAAPSGYRHHRLHLRPLLTGTGLLRRRTTTHLLLRLLLGIAESILSLLICRHCHCAFSFTEKALVTAG
jgi:hypothetical protein